MTLSRHRACGLVSSTCQKPTKEPTVGASRYDISQTRLLVTIVVGERLSRRQQGGQMRRRDFVGFLPAMSVLPRAARAQQHDKVRLIGVLMGFAESDPTHRG